MKKQNSHVNSQDHLEGKCCIKSVFAENSSDIMWAIDPNYCLIWGNELFNQHSKEYLGHILKPGENVLGENVLEQESRKWKTYYDLVLHDNESHSIEFRTPELPTGKIIECHFSAIKDETGNITGVATIGRDITKHINALTEHTQLLEILKTSEKITKTGSWKWDVNSQTMHWSEQVFAIHDLDPADFSDNSNDYIEKSIQCYYPEERPAILEAFNKCIEQGIPYDLKCRFKTAKGRDIWIRTKGEPLMVNGRVEKVIGYIQDITIEKQHEETIRQSEEKFRALVEQTSQALFLHDMNGNIVDVNKAAVNLTGYTHDELLQLTVFDIDPDAENRLDKNNIWGSLEPHSEKAFESNHQRKDGHCYPVEIHVSKITFGHTNYILALAKDITEKKAAEQMLNFERDRAKQYLEVAAVMLLALDSKGNIATIKRKGCEILGLEHEQIVGKNWFEHFIPKSSRQTVKQVFRRIINGELKSVEFLENQILTANGDELLIAWHNALLFDKEGNITGTLSSGEDITKKRKAEERLRHSEKEFKSIFENAPFGIYRTSLDGKILLGNPHLLKILECESFEGLSRRNLKSEGFDSNYPREDFLNKVSQQGEIHNLESSWITCKGNTIIVRESARMINDQDGNLICFEGMVEDITEWKSAETALKASEQRSRALLDAIPDLMFRLDKNGTYLDYKAAQSELFYQNNDIIGKNNRELTPQWFADLVDEKISLAFSSGKIQEFEYQLTIPGKGVQDYEARMAPSGNDEVMTIVRNITEQKRARLKIAESEANLRASMEATSDVFVLLDKNGTVIESNEFHAKRLGMTRKELLGKNVFEFLPEEIGSIRKQHVEQVIKTNEPFFGEDFRAGHWNEFAIYPIFIDGSPIDRVVVYSRDITERKKNELLLAESEAKYRSLFENMTQGVFYQSANGKVIDANKASLEIFGISRNQFLGIDSYHPRWKIFDEAGMLLPPEKHPSMVSLLEGKPSINSLIGVFIPELNRYKWMIVNAIPQFQKNETKPYQVFVTLQDITALKEAEEALHRSEQNLRELNSSKDKFFSIIAHDLKSPFNSIIGLSDLLVEQLKEKDYDGIDEMAEMILKSSNHAHDLLTNLLEWSRMQTGRMQFEPLFVELVALTNENIKLLKQSAEQKHISIEKQMPAIAPLLCDKNMINTVIRNLISNAVKFTPENGRILISIKAKPAEIEISVTDTGMGISAENLNKLFRIDSNFSTPGTNRETGTGLGLLLCKEFIQKHNGKIMVESEPGKGSIFTFTLPKSF
jgi:PAS domain S-box-containing protein